MQYTDVFIMGSSSSTTPLLWMKLQGTVTDLRQDRKPGTLSCFSFRVTRMCERYMSQINPHTYLKGLCVRVFRMVSLVESWRPPGFLSVGDSKRNVLIVSSTVMYLRRSAGTSRNRLSEKVTYSTVQLCKLKTRANKQYTFCRNTLEKDTR